MTLQEFKSTLKENIIEYSVRYNEAEKELDYERENQSEELEYFDYDGNDDESNSIKTMNEQLDYLEEIVKKAKHDVDVLFCAFENIENYNYTFILKDEFENDPISTLKKYGKTQTKKQTPYKHIRI